MSLAAHMIHVIGITYDIRHWHHMLTIPVSTRAGHWHPRKVITINNTGIVITINNTGSMISINKPSL